MARGAFERFTERISQLYEQGADYLRIGEYVNGVPEEWYFTESNTIFAYAESVRFGLPAFALV